MGLEDHGADWARHIDLILNDVRAVLADAAPVDLVVFTGDLTQSGRPDEFHRLDREVLEPLWNIPGNNPPLLAVPGNHDLQRSAGSLDKKIAADLLISPLRML